MVKTLVPVFASRKALNPERGVSFKSVSNALLERALELKEDHYFSKIGEERVAKKSKRISHKEIWD